MALFVGGVADGKNIETSTVCGLPVEEVWISHVEQPPVRWVMQLEGPTMPKVSADVYRFCDGEYRYERTI